MAAPKYYVVWEGKTPGVYRSWAACKEQTDDYPAAKYRSFATLEEAENALKKGYAQYYKENPSNNNSGSKNTGSSQGSKTGKIITPSISVDAACSGNPGKMEYRGVDTATGQEIFYQGVFDDGTNNIGEFLALVHALAMLKKQGAEVPIYSDSQTAIAWVRKKKANTKLELTKRNAKLFELLERAEKWLAENTYTTRIYKWDTEHWGEIPADFGRKG